MIFPKKYTFAAAFLHATQSMSTDIYIVALPLIGMVFSASLQQVQATMIAFVAGLAVSHGFIGGLADHFGRKPTAIIGMSIYIVATFIAYFSTSIEMLTVMRFIQGLAAATGPIVMRAIVRDLSTPQTAPQAFSRVGLYAGFGPILAPIVGAISIYYFGWQGSLGALMIYGAFVVIFVTLVLPETLKPEHKQKELFGTPFKALKILFASSDFIKGAILIGAGYGGLYAWLSTSSYILSVKLNFVQHETSLFIASCAAIFFLGTFITNALIKKISTGALLRFAGCVGLLSASLCAYLVANHQPKFLTLFLAIIPFYIGWGMMQPLAMGIAMRPFASIAGQASAWFGIAQFIGAMSFAYLAGQFGGGTFTFLTMALAMLIILGVGVKVKH